MLSAVRGDFLTDLLSDLLYATTTNIQVGIQHNITDKNTLPISKLFCFIRVMIYLKILE